MRVGCRQELHPRTAGRADLVLRPDPSRERHRGQGGFTAARRDVDDQAAALPVCNSLQVFCDRFDGPAMGERARIDVLPRVNQELVQALFVVVAVDQTQSVV